MGNADEIKSAENKADAVGKKIAETKIFKTFKEIHEKLKKDEEAKKILDHHQKTVMKVMDLEKEGKPVEVADKHELRDAQDKLHQNVLLQEYAKAQADFQEIMNRVTQAIHQHIHLEAIWEDEE